MNPSPIQRKLRAYLVHALTASGVVFAFLAAIETASATPDPRWVFVWLAVAVLIDAADGPLARRWQVKVYAARINGRTIDDIVDYLTFTFIPLLLIWRMGWVPSALWLLPALVASLFGFANQGAKQEAEGFFLGFPSYWNGIAFYAGLWAVHYGPYVPGVVILVLSALTVLPVRFLYPTQTPAPWRAFIIIGALLWLVGALALLPWYPRVPLWLVWVSLLYPAFYVGVSVYLDVRTRVLHS